MNFENVISLSIPEGTCKYIYDKNNVLLWSRPKVYGVHWLGGTSPKMTRTDDSGSFNNPTIGKGSSSGSSPFDDCYPWNEIKIVNKDGNVLVSIPKFWYKWTKDGVEMKLQISDKPLPDFYTSPMHAARGDGVGERDVAYIGKYKCASDYKSKRGYAPKVSITIGSARTGIANLGNGYYQHDYAAFWTLRMLFLVEYATWDSQSVLENTTDFSSLANVVSGSTSTMSYHTGISEDGKSVQYRYVEDPWENMLEWLDGIYFSGSNMYCINNPKNFATGSNGTKIGTRTTSNGYIKSWTVPSNSKFKWALIPSSCTDVESYTSDKYYYTSSGTVAYIGGARNAWDIHGAFFMYTDFDENSSSIVISTRLMYLPS